MRVIAGIILIVIFCLGLARLLFVNGPTGAIDSETAQEIAQCLGAHGDIAANAAVTILSLPQTAKPASKPNAQGATTNNPQAAGEKLAFTAIGPVKIELTDATGRGKPGDVYQLPEPTQVIVVAEGGTFEFGLDRGRWLLQTDNDGQFLFAAKKKVRFGPAPKTSYQVELPANTKIELKDENEKRIGFVTAGTVGSLDIGLGQSLIALQPLPTSPWLEQTLPTLLPARALGQQGLSELTIIASQSGVVFNDPGFALAACARSPAVAGWTAAGIVETKAQTAGAATVRLAIPPDVLPALPSITSILLPVRVVIASRDGRYRGYGGFSAIAKGYSAIAAVVITALLFLWASQMRHTRIVVEEEAAKAAVPGGGVVNKKIDKARWFSGLFIGVDKEPSLSLFQIFFWTVITVWGLVYVYAVSGALLTVTTSMMALLGIAGTGSVLSRWVAASNATESPPSGYPKFEFWQILSTNGIFDLLKLQLFVFTLTIGIYVVWRIADTAAFPDLDTNTLLLLGVSQGIYVGGKLAGATALSSAQAIKLELDTRTAARDNIDLVKSRADLAALDAKKTAGTFDPVVDQPEYDKLTSAIKKAEDLDKVIPVLREKLKQAVKDLGLTP